MKKLNSILQELFYHNSYVIFVILLFLIKPYFLGVNHYINVLANVVMMISILGIYFLSFYKNKPSKFQFAVFLFMLISLISTSFGSKDYTFWLKFFLQYTGISLYTEGLIKNNLQSFFRVLSKLLYLLILANFVTLLIKPDGIIRHEVLLLGYDNATVVLLLLGTMFICFASYYFNNKLDKFSITSLLMVFLTYLIRWSVGAIIGCIVILMYFLLIYKKRNWSNFLNIRTFYWGTFILFILIVVFGVQKYFSFIIVDIFHKNVTLTGRTYIWERCFQQILAHPFLGIGMMEYQRRYDLIRIYHAHCNFLNVILETGLVGFAAYTYLWHLPIKSLLKNKKDELVNLLSYALLSFLVISLIDVIDNSELVYIFLNLAYFSPYIIHSREKKLNRKHILIVLDSGQPLPAIMGGAVETLTDYYLEENKKKKQYVIDVYSTLCKDTKLENLDDTYTHYYFINKRTVSFQLKRYCKGVYQKLTRRKLESIFSYEVLDNIEIENKETYYDLVIIENSPSLILNLKRKIKAKYILHLHNDLENVKHHNHSFEKYDLVIPCSTYILKRVKEAYPNTNLLNVYNGIEEKSLLKYKKERDKIRKQYHIRENDVVFGFCGRICEDKGVKELVLAFKNLLKKNKNIKLVITGNSFFKSSAPTPYIQELQKLTVGLEDKIIFTGYIDHNQIGTYYTMLDVSMQPSIFNEACPLTILEAQIMGLPIIGTDSGGTPELVTKDNAIIISRKNMICDLENAMQILIDDSVLRKKMGKISEKNSKQYYVNNYLKKFFKTIESLIEVE